MQKELCFGSKKAWNGPVSTIIHCDYGGSGMIRYYEHCITFFTQLTDVTDLSQYDVKITRHSDFTPDKQSLDILQFFLRGSTVSKVDISTDDCSSLADEQRVGTEDVARSCTEEHKESVEDRKVLNVESDAKNAGMVNCNDEPYTDNLDPPLKEQPCDTTYMQSKEIIALSCAPQGVDGMSSDLAVDLFNLDDRLENPYGDGYSSQLNCESDTEGGAEIVDVSQSVIVLDDQDVKHQDVDKTITSGSQDETGVESDSIHNGALNLDQASEHFSDTYVFDETKQQAASGYIETSTGGHNRTSSGTDDGTVFDFCCEEI